MTKLLSRALLLFTGAFLLTACVSNPIPEGYSGPLAHIADSITPRSDHSADFFYLKATNHKEIDNSLRATIQSSSGQGSHMSKQLIERAVPATAATFTIVGRTHYAMPILELVNAVYQVSGDIDFTPLPDHRYLVKGVLGENYSAVWIEDAQTGEVQGHKIEVQSSSSLDLLSK